MTDVDSFITALDAAGFDVSEGQVADLGFPVWPAARSASTGVRVTACEFASEAGAGDVRSAITPDGFGIPSGGEALAHVDWIGPPHLFAGGKLIVLYIAYRPHDRQDERRTLDALEIILGRQFAGSDEGGRSTEPGQALITTCASLPRHHAGSYSELTGDRRGAGPLPAGSARRDVAGAQGMDRWVQTRSLGTCPPGGICTDMRERATIVGCRERVGLPSV